MSKRDSSLAGRASQRTKKSIIALGALAAGLSIPTAAFASSHSEAPGVASDPEVDNTDVWAFVNSNNGDFVVVAGFNGLWDHAAPNYKKFATEGAIYEIHVVRGATDLDDDLKYVFEFSEADYAKQDPANLSLGPLNLGGKEFFSQLSGGGAWGQTYKVTKVENGVSKVILNNVPVAPPNVGPRTTSAYNALLGGGDLTYEQRYVDNGPTAVVRSIAAADGGGRVFAGPRQDEFYVDLGAVFDLAGLPDVAPAAPFGGLGAVRAMGAQRSSTSYKNIMAIALAIPATTANGKALTAGAGTDDLVGVWVSASRRQVTILRNDGSYDSAGPYRQVSRLGLPLINEAVIGLQDKDRWNRKRPKDDVTLFGAYFLNPVIVRDAQGVGLYGPGGTLSAIGCGTDGGGGVIDGKDNAALGINISDLRTNRTDILTTINLGYNIPLSATGDVLRVDLSNPNDLLGNANFSIPTSIAPNRVTENRGAFPNGRRLNLTQEADVTDIEVTLLLCGLPFMVDSGLTGAIGGGAINGGVVGDRVSRMPHDNRTTFPYLSAPVAQSDVRPATQPGNTATCAESQSGACN
ncbi:MAG: DUF4331 domain-containing protein [Polyangiaceae bacterium]